MSSYADQLKSHLATYKQERLGVTEHGAWRGNQRQYPHILPESMHRLNILDGIRDDFWRYFEANSDTIGLHTDFHHLNSSQACAFNLLYPWLARPEAHSHLLQSLGLPDEGIAEWWFEHMPDQEERTTVDCYLRLPCGACVLIEVKLTESSFGAAVKNAAREQKRTGTYLRRLQGKVKPECLDEGFFYLNYQLLRNVSHLDLGRGDRLLLVLPRANALTWKKGEKFLDHLEPAARGAVRLVAMEDLVTALRSGDPGGASGLGEHLDALCEKYAFAMGTTSGPASI